MSMTATFDFTSLVQGVIGLFLILMGFLLNEMWTHIKNNKKSADESLSSLVEALNATQLELAKNYVSYDRFQEVRKEILAVMHQIEDKIDNLRNNHGNH